MHTRWSTGWIRILYFGLSLSFASMAGIVQAAESQPIASSQNQEHGSMSAEELNRQLNNPVSSVWSMVFQNNYTQLKSGSQDVPG